MDKYERDLRDNPPAIYVDSIESGSTFPGLTPEQQGHLRAKRLSMREARLGRSVICSDESTGVQSEFEPAEPRYSSEA